MDNYNFGNKLCSLREGRNLTQKELAKILDVSDKAISKWENGQSIPRMETLEKISNFFNIGLEELLTDNNNEIERRRVLLRSYKTRSERIEKGFLNFLWSAIALVVLVCVFDSIVYLAFGKSNLADVIEQNIIVVGFPLMLFTIYIVITSFILPAIKQLSKVFRLKYDCIEAEDETQKLGKFINAASAILSIIPMGLIIVDFADDKSSSIWFYIIIYLTSSVLLSISALTLKYKYTDLFFTENGIFIDSVEYGDFYTYSSFENLKSNYNDVCSCVDTSLKIEFFIDGKKYKAKFDDEDNIKNIASYIGFIDNNNSNKNNQKFKFGIVAYIFIAIGIVIMITGFILFVSDMQFGTQEIEYTKTYTDVVSIAGGTEIIEYNDKIFCLSEQNCSVDIFDSNGEFLYSNRVPIDQNGLCKMYIKNDNLYIISRSQAVYRYDMNGAFLGRCDNFWDDDIHKIKSFDANDNLLNEYTGIPEDNIILYFDDKSLLLKDYLNDKTVTYTQSGKIEKSLKTTENDIDLIDGAITSNSNNSEAHYYTLRGSLYKSSGSESIVIYKGSFFDWYRHSIPACWLTIVLGMGIVGLTRYISAKVYKKKEEK